MPQRRWVFFAILGMLSGACTDSPADLVVWNAQVLTVDSAFSQAEALAIRDGVFVAVGANDEVREFIGKQTRVIDAGGKTVIPGLIETHVHTTRAARGEAVQAFVQLGSIAEIQQWLRTQAEQTPAGRWIRLPRVDVTRIQEGRIPTSAELDEAAPDHPAVFIWAFANRQIQVLNAAALKAAGITKDTPVSEECTIHLGEDGEPTGRLENCGELTARFLKQPDVPEQAYLRSLERLLGRYNEVGITSIGERNSDAAGYRAYEKLKEQARLTARVRVTIGLSSDGTVEGTENVIRSLPFQYGDGDDWVRVGPLKLRVDGGILYGSAYMREPYGETALSFYGYEDPTYHGELLIRPQELKNMIYTGQRMGWQMVAHVTGDAGVDAVLNAVEAANADLPERERRFTLIHAYFPNQQTAERAARLGVGVDTQPAWYYKDGDALLGVLGTDRLRKFIGLGVWQRASVKVAINSDHMQGADPNTSLNPYNPFLTMYTAITRRTEDGQVIGPRQRVSREDALRMMTIDAAWLGFAETRKGSIEVGKLGDLAILSDDLLSCDVEDIKDIRSLLTVVGGNIVYESEAGGFDKNGVALLFATNGMESYTPSHNFRNDGKRWDFRGDYHPAVDIGGYYKINSGNDEISFKVFGGAHTGRRNDPSTFYSRCYNTGITFDGNRLRLRIEHQHPRYTRNLEEKTINLGSIVGRFVGFRQIVYVSEDDKSVRIVTLVDNTGLTADGKPANDWKVIGDWTDNGQYPFGPYVDYPYSESNAQQTIRIDAMDIEHQYVFCRQIDPAKPLTNIVKLP